MKRPAFQFYPADWRKDAAVQSCSMAARGLWHEMLCIMHECQPYGHLTVNGTPMTPPQLARLVGESSRDVQAWLAEIEAAGVFSRTEDGCIFSRRMVSDERLRVVRAAAGRLGGNPNLLNQKDKQEQNQTVNQPGNQSSTASSSSSSSTTVEGETRASPARLACLAMREAGVAAVNPSNADLLELLAAGATPESFGDLAREILVPGNSIAKPFPYLLSVMRSRMAAAAQAAPAALAKPRRTTHDERAATIAGLTTPGTPGERDITGVAERVD